MDIDSQIKILEAQIRECFGRVVYSHKTHEKCAEILLQQLRIIQIWQIILSAITTGGLISAIFANGKTAIIIGTISSTILLALNTFTKNNDLSEQAQLHKKTANSLWYIREKYISLLVDLRVQKKAVKNLQAERDGVLEELKLVYSNAPNTNNKAYKKAQKALQVSEDMTFSDNEIDVFLPRELRASNDYKKLEGKENIPHYVKS